MRDEDFFGVPVVMPKAKERERALSISDSRPWATRR